MPTSKKIAIIAAVSNFLTCFNCICSISELDLSELGLGEFQFKIKILILLFGALKTFFSCKGVTIKSRLCVPKYLSILSLVISGALLFINFVVESPICEISADFKIIFAGGLSFVNDSIHPISLSMCFFAYVLGTFFCCCANVLEAIEKGNINK